MRITEECCFCFFEGDDGAHDPDPYRMAVNSRAAGWSTPEPDTPATDPALCRGIMAESVPSPEDENKDTTPSKEQSNEE